MTRKCNNPVPSCGGNECIGSNIFPLDCCPGKIMALCTYILHLSFDCIHRCYTTYSYVYYNTYIVKITRIMPMYVDMLIIFITIWVSLCSFLGTENFHLTIGNIIIRIVFICRNC